MYLFENETTSNYFQSIKSQIEKEISQLKNEQIFEVDLKELEEYYISHYFIEKLEILKDNIDIEVIETNIRERNPFYHGYSDLEPEYYNIDGYKIIFSILFDGNESLLYLRPSSFYLSRFPMDRVISPDTSNYGKLIFSLKYKKNSINDVDNLNDFLSKEFNREIKTYYETIDRINLEIKKFNSSLPSIIETNLKKRQKKVNEYFNIRKKLSLPLKLNPYAPNTKPIPLKKIRTKKEYPSKKKMENDYEISDNDYNNINSIISLSCISIEKSARTFYKLQEEELRDVILSNLNTHYQGNATGETFNKTGKTDIYIPFENKAAYIAECKIWHGKKKFEEAINQLCGYVTWRDSKTSLIIFNKENKDFSSLLLTIDESIYQNCHCQKIIRKNKNVWQGSFIKENDSKDTIIINISVYDLYIKQ